MLSAMSGSFLTSVLVTPLDVVRVRLQSQPQPPRISTLPSGPPAPFSNLPPNLGVTSCCREVFWVNNNAEFCVAAVSPSSTAPAECAAEEVQRRTFTSTLDGLQKIARNEGLGSLWRGLSPTLVMAIPANVIYFTGYDWLRYSKRSPIAQRMPDTYIPLVAGSMARVGAATVISPIEMFRTRLQAGSTSSGGGSQGRSTSLFTDTWRGLKTMVHQQGYTSLWRGLTLTLWRDVPFSGFYWWGYEAIRNALTDARTRAQARGQAFDGPGSHATLRRAETRRLEKHSTTLVDSFIAGATSGAVAAILTMPFDVGKTRQQIRPTAPPSPSSSSLPSSISSSAAAVKATLRPEQLSMPRFLYHIFQEEGMAGLWRGWAARCLKVAPACAIMISSYEIGKKMARGINERRGEMH
ncbi:MAG: hypothetical protein M1838_005842 [Thelocarpon superellum]|nr:MAG: hypothetical protein M1838_005842 [Thelocarpon superellum]